MKVFVTGATGFLGGRLCLALIKAGYQVDAMTRSDSLPPELLNAGVQPIKGDISNAAAMAERFAGVERVFHTAAYVKTWTRDRKQFDITNIRGTRRLIEAARVAGVKRIIYTSSFMALGPTDNKVGDEMLRHDPLHLHNDYERTKFLALGEVRELRDNENLDILITFPGVVYGPGEMTSGNLVVNTMLQYLHRKLPGRLGSGEKKWCYAFVEDVVQGHLEVADKAPRGGEYVLGGPNVSQNEFLDIMEKLSGVKAPKLHLPFWLARVAGGWELLLANLFGRQPINPPNVVEVFRHDWSYSSDKAISDLGYKITPLEEGLKITLDWLISKGLWKKKG